jgi:hypothetical protein
MNSGDTRDFPLPTTAEESQELLDVLIKEHAERSAERAVERLGGPLTAENMERYMGDSACLRYPTQIIYSREGLDEHQFAEAFFLGDEAGRICVLHVHPQYAGRREALPLFLAYMAPVINYGHIVTPEVCESYGAMVLGMEVAAYYAALCAVVDGG